MALFNHLPLKEKMFFARHMAIMSRSGMQIIDILKTLKKQTKSKMFSKILDELVESVKNGQFLSDGLSKHQKLFGDFFINIVHVGEISGTLADNLEYLAESLKKKKELQSKVTSALIYPIIILGATFALTGALTFFVFPKILPIFTSLNVPLPLITKIFIAVSSFMISHGVLVFIGAFGAIVGVWLLLRIPSVRFFWHRVMIRTPALGPMVVNYNLVGFVRSLSLLLKSGIKIIQALEITAKSSSNLVYKKVLNETAESVGQGEPLSKNLNAHPHYFPAVFTEMLSVGEETGRLTDTGTYLADYYESELDNSSRALSNVLEPLMLLIMGFIVGFIAMAIIMPIYEVTQYIHP